MLISHKRPLRFHDPEANATCIKVENGVSWVVEPFHQTGSPLPPKYSTACTSKGYKKHLRCILPSELPRFCRNIAVENNARSWQIEPRGHSRVQSLPLVTNWLYHVHPLGQPYFECTRSNSRFRYLTEADVAQPLVLDEITTFMLTLEQKAINFPQISIEAEVVLDIGDEAWSYYMVDVQTRRIFWMDKNEVTLSHFGIERVEHLRYKLNAEFWKHVDYFPCHRPLLPGVLDELMGILIHSHIDVLTSTSSHVRYDGPKIQSLKESVSRMQELYEPSTANGYIASASARLMEEIAEDRFRNFYGFRGARLSLDQSVRGTTKESRTWLITLLSPILLRAPEGHLSLMRDLWIDESILPRRWQPMITQLEREWDRYILYSALLLAANVAFLIVNSLSPGRNHVLTFVAKQLSYVSIAASFGSIFSGFSLLRRTRTGCEDKTSDTVAYLRRIKNSSAGLETLAIQYSLPFAMLAWCCVTLLGVVFFTCAGLYS